MGKNILFLFFCWILPTTAFANGEIVGGYPNWEEMMQLVLTNRVRQDPAQAKKDYHDPTDAKNLTWESKTYPTCDPLLYLKGLGQAARAHSKDMADQAYFSHTGLDNSSPGDRISRFVTGFRGWAENIAYGQKTAEIVTDGWLNSDGHRENIFKCSLTHLGVGYHLNKSGRPYWTQNFATFQNVQKLFVYSAIHFPFQGTVGNAITFYANYKDATGKAPSSAKIVVGGKCNSMLLEYGTNSNGNYETQINLAKGCHPYYFQFTSSTGAVENYPTTGSYQVGVGTNCNELYISTRKEETCTGNVPQPTCQQESDCPSGKTCSKGTCVIPAPSGQCVTNTECKPNQECNQGNCQEKVCQKDEECAEKEKCNAGKCVAKTVCSKHSECPVMQICENSFCLPIGTQGKTCEGAGDCDSKQDCIPWDTRSTCGTTCKDNSECPQQTTCEDFGGGRLYCKGRPVPPKVEEPTSVSTKPQPPSVGCSTIHSPAPNILWVLFFVFALALRKYRS